MYCKEEQSDNKVVKKFRLKGLEVVVHLESRDS